MSVVGMVCLVLVSVSGYAVLCVRHFYASASSSFVLSDRSQISSLSADCKKRLGTFFTAHKVSYSSPTHFSDELKKQFPFLKKITFSYKNQKKTLVHVQTARPLVVFNNQIAITDQKNQVAQVDFEESVLAGLPHFSLVQAETSCAISEECIKYARELDPAVHAFYDVEWVDSSLIKFHDKQHPNITVLGCAETQAKTILQPECRELTLTLLERKTSKRSAASASASKNYGVASHSSEAVVKVNSYDWCIDRRFKGQMIVFPGGRGNEKTVCG